MKHRIDIGAQVPRWGNVATAALGRSALAALGWRLDVQLPNLPKFIVIEVPHTSNWEAVIGIAAILAMRIRVHWWSKHTVFRWPFRGVLRWLGGIPVDRSASRGAVPQMVEEMKQRPQFVLGLAPEGTRKAVTKWRTGFYQIALAAGVPIVLA